ncbi:MAG: DUF2189 domain-containing protein [Rubrivivax sp.]|nr:DUF2189 domain-containing protein [Rubrivivax sp.]
MTATPAPPTPAVALRPLGFADPLRWLALGWADFRRAPTIGLFYGGCFTVMGWALMRVYEHAPAYLLALSAGFLLVAPFLCLGLYHVSRELQAGRRPDFGASLMAWDSRTGQLGIFAFVLLVLEMLWARSTLVIFAVTFDGMPDFKGSLAALFNPENMTFIVAWIVVGAVFATLIFSVSVVSMPMLLDRSTDAITAALTSLRLVLAQPPVMFFWGALIAAVTFAAMLPWFVGLVVVAPVIGHASWHAYRAAVAD